MVNLTSRQLIFVLLIDKVAVAVVEAEAAVMPRSRNRIAEDLMV